MSGIAVTETSFMPSLFCRTALLSLLPLAIADAGAADLLEVPADDVGTASAGGSVFASVETTRERGMMVSLDHAKLLKVARPAASIIIGNPAIVDATVHDSKTLILTGRSYGVTNLIILDNDGDPILETNVTVKSSEDGTVRVFRQAERSTYACAPECEPTVTVGDNSDSFTAASGQFTSHQQLATGGH
ncbi:pilus assembly protein N-terminal domain-containing protein [Aurantimonas sp. MSK8Z-1]|uniref:pilus assembly protein N-terminal domain-containing protein n=1 Tax=Mangrovibrevibacter kandeliae TaxID=2968473 RepID=UPI0021182100|nr:pilus assembly protein N-terminal domain-containing protein [Aurantimonas sp. MSK8Z-1]MCW4115963.1 pilus assembly protein N-terminal domain-containing protein [Aurantimonas sp. MSK8Z-1]